jgi:hypothetical protein
MWHERGEEEYVYVIGRKAGGKETTKEDRRPRHRWMDNIKMELL